MFSVPGYSLGTAEWQRSSCTKTGTDKVCGVPDVVGLQPAPDLADIANSEECQVLSPLQSH